MHGPNIVRLAGTGNNDGSARIAENWRRRRASQMEMLRTAKNAHRQSLCIGGLKCKYQIALELQSVSGSLCTSNFRDQRTHTHISRKSLGPHSPGPTKRMRPLHRVNYKQFYMSLAEPCIVRPKVYAHSHTSRRRHRHNLHCTQFNKCTRRTGCIKIDLRMPN